MSVGGIPQPVSRDEDRNFIAGDFSPYRKHTASWHCVPGIRREIEEQLFDVSLSRLDVRQDIT